MNHQHIKPWEERCKEDLSPGVFDALGDSVKAIAESYMVAEISDLRARIADLEAAALAAKPEPRECEVQLWSIVISQLNRLRALSTASMELAANLCALGTVTVGRVDHVRRDSVMNEVVEWRDKFNALPDVNPEKLRAALAAIQPAPDLSYEQQRAVMEGERNAASGAYFKARTHLMDTVANRNIFDAGFQRGYEARPADIQPAALQEPVRVAVAYGGKDDLGTFTRLIPATAVTTNEDGSFTAFIELPSDSTRPTAPDIAQAIHYPDCWDTACYSTLADALSAVYDHFKCSECSPTVPDAAVRDAARYRWLVEAAGAYALISNYTDYFQHHMRADTPNNKLSIDKAIDAALAASPAAVRAMGEQ